MNHREVQQRPLRRHWIHCPLVGRLAVLSLEAYRRANLPLLTEDPKFKYMYDHNINMSLISRTYANVGDDWPRPGRHRPSAAQAGSFAHRWLGSGFQALARRGQLREGVVGCPGGGALPRCN